jgi:hypothetical protein
LKANWLTATPSAHVAVAAAFAALGASIAASGTITVVTAANSSLCNISLSPTDAVECPAGGLAGASSSPRYRAMASA